MDENTIQKYLKFPLTLPLSPMGRGRGEGGGREQNIKDKF